MQPLQGWMKIVAHMAPHALLFRPPTPHLHSTHSATSWKLLIGTKKSWPQPLHLQEWSGQLRGVTRSFLQGIPGHSKHLAMDEELPEESQCFINQNYTLPVLTSSDVLVEESGSENNQPELESTGLLTPLQVQSSQKQVPLSSPVYPEGLYALYASYFAGNLVEQMWDFTWPAALALLHDSLLPVAVISFFSKLGIFLGGPCVGAFLDSQPRVFAFSALNVVQTVAQIISAAMIIYALKMGTFVACSTSSVLVQPWFLVLVAAGAVERLTGLASGVAHERDWVVLLAGANRPIALAHANSMLCRLDLCSEITGTLLFGILLSKFHPSTCLMLAATVMIASLPVLIFLVRCTNKLSKGALDRSKHNNICDKEIQNAFERGGVGVQKIKLGWTYYLSQTTLPVSLAAVFLNFNIGLAPGSLMTSFLTHKGLNPSVIGAFTGLGAVMGFVSTFISAKLIQKCGMLKAGAIGLVFQAFLLITAVAVYCNSSLTELSSLIFFLLLIVLSRLGHFTYDIIGGQILQTAVPPSQANIVGTTEISLASLAELLMLSVAIIAKDASHFGNLIVLSMAAVCGAACLYYRWMSQITERQRISLSPSCCTDDSYSLQNGAAETCSYTVAL